MSDGFYLYQQKTSIVNTNRRKNSKGGGGGGAPQRSPTYPSYTGPSKTRSSNMQPRNARVDDGFDEDLKKALAMSLEEVKSHSRGYAAPVANGFSSGPPKTNGGTPEAAKALEEDDADLKAAIAASLSDMEEQKKRLIFSASTGVSS